MTHTPSTIAHDNEHQILRIVGKYVGLTFEDLDTLRENLRLIPEESFKSEEEEDSYSFLVLHGGGYIGVTGQMREGEELENLKCRRL
jgi:hypothetical protein